jgi:GDP-L-fucose synthase
MHLNDKIYIAGHLGLVGSAILRCLKARGFNNLITRTHTELDLTNQAVVNKFFFEEKPAFVILAAAKVGGIHANYTFPADFIYQNLMIEANVIHAAYENKVKRLLFLGSTCIYPKNAEQPMKENALFSGPLEPTNEPYAISKIAGIKLCESYNRQFGTDFRSVMPTNLYGINDNFHSENSHVIPALMKRIHNSKMKNEGYVEVWGTGNAMREFLYVDDMAEASLFVFELDKEQYDSSTKKMLSHLNVGTGQEVSIKEMANILKKVIGYEGELVFNNDMPDGAPRKLVDTSNLSNLGWRFNTDLESGLQSTYKWYLSEINE